MSALRDYLGSAAFTDARAFFSDWPVVDMLNDEDAWSVQPKSACVYIVYSERRSSGRSNTRDGCCSELRSRLATAGGVRRSRNGRPPSQWQLAMYGYAPMLRNWSTRSLRTIVKSCRGGDARIQRALVLAHSTGFVVRVARGLVEGERPLLPRTASTLAAIRQADGASFRHGYIDDTTLAAAEALNKCGVPAANKKKRKKNPPRQDQAPPPVRLYT